MNATNQEALPTVRAVAPSVAVQRPLSDESIKTSTQALIKAMASEHEAVEADTQRLEVLRKYKQRLSQMRQRNKADAMLGSLIDTQEDKVQEAQTELSKSTGRLTQTSLQLLLTNTTTAQAHGTHQKALQEQQKWLQEHAEQLKDQTHKLREKQKQLHKEQIALQTAQEGLMQAHGITKEQARELVGCVEKVSEAEQRLSAANLALHQTLQDQLEAAVKACIDQLNTGFSSLDLRHRSFEEQLTSTLSAQSKRTRERLALFTQASADFEISITQQLQQHTQAMVDYTAAQHALMVQQQEAHAAQLQTSQHDHRQDLTTTLEDKTRALHAAIEGAAHTVQAEVQTQRAAFEREVQRVDVALNGITGDLGAAHTGLGHTKASVSALADQMNVALDGINDKLTTTHKGLGHTNVSVSALAEQISQLQAQQRTDQRHYRWALAAVGGIALASIAWHLFTRYALL